MNDPRPSRRPRAFTLLEVMIAMGIFFLAIFSILELVSQNLRAARLLQPTGVDATPVIEDLMLTNRIEEESISGNFGNLYPGYSWTREVYLKSTNGFFGVDITIYRAGGSPQGESTYSLELFRPESVVKGGGGAGRGFQTRMGN